MKHINQTVKKIMLYENRKETLFQVSVFSMFLFCLFLWEPISMYYVFTAIQTGKVERIVCASVAGGLFLLLFMGVQYVNNTYGDMNTWKIITNVRERFFRVYFNTDYYEVHTAFKEGELFDRIYNSGMGIMDYFINYSVIIVFVILGIGFCCYYLQLVSFIFLPIILLVPFELYLTRIISCKISKLEEKKRKYESIRTEKGERLLDNLEFSIMYGMEEVLLEDYLHLIRESRKQQKKKELWQESIQSIHIFLQSCMQIVLEREIMYRLITMADSVTLILVLDKLTQILREMISRFLEISQKKIMIKRIFELEEYINPAILSEQNEEQKENEAIVVKGLAVRQQNIDILKEINLSVNRGEKVALIGENGSGKSTLLKALLGLVLPSGGQCFINGINTKTWGIRQRREISYIPAEPLLFSETVEDNLNMGSEEDNELLWTQALGHCTVFKDRTVEELSGGQRQLVNIGRGIYRNGSILIADEPTSHLSREKAEEVMKWMLDSSDTCLIITHDDSLLPLFGRVIKMEKGLLREL